MAWQTKETPHDSKSAVTQRTHKRASKPSKYYLRHHRHIQSIETGDDQSMVASSSPTLWMLLWCYFDAAEQSFEMIKNEHTIGTRNRSLIIFDSRFTFLANTPIHQTKLKAQYATRTLLEFIICTSIKRTLARIYIHASKHTHIIASIAWKRIQSTYKKSTHTHKSHQFDIIFGTKSTALRCACRAKQKKLYEFPKLEMIRYVLLCTKHQTIPVAFINWWCSGINHFSIGK